MGLLRSWSAFLDGAEAQKQTNNRRPGADDDTWAAQQKRISGFQHYQIDGALRLPPQRNRC
jgi:outer membrane biogenesis lipoprotein LolB